MILRLSCRLAVTTGVLLPLAETRAGGHSRSGIRPRSWTIISSVRFCCTARGVAREPGQWTNRSGSSMGFACGLGYASFFGHVRTLGAPDPAGVSHVWIASIIRSGCALCIAALIATIRAESQSTISMDNRK